MKNILEENKSSIAQLTIERNGNLIEKVVEISKDGTIGIKGLARTFTFLNKNITYPNL